MLPLATGGSPHHMLALDALPAPGAPQSLGAKHILPGIAPMMPKSRVFPKALHRSPRHWGQIDDAAHILLSETLAPGLVGRQAALRRWISRKCAVAFKPS